MKPAPIEFFAPPQIDELLSLLAEHGESARVLAGGQSLIPLMNLRMLRPEVVVSLNNCLDLSYCRATGSHLIIGALARQIEVEDFVAVRDICPLLASALPQIGSIAIRNRGTVCGSLAHADPLAELPAVAVALDAEMLVSSSRGQRVLTASEFFVSELASAMTPEELLQEVRIPRASEYAGAAFLEICNRQHGFAVAGVGAQIVVGADGVCGETRLAAMCGGPTPVRLVRTEKLLAGQRLNEALLKEASHVAQSEVEPGDTPHADSTYCREIVGVLVERATLQAAEASRRKRLAKYDER
jgi:carbon-monoxide dehydrogenase medium subunit